MTKLETPNNSGDWVRSHYVVDSNFLIDYPILSIKDRFSGRFRWPFEPFVVVVCDVVLAELDHLKLSSDKNKKFMVREAVRSIEKVLDDEGRIHFFGHLKIFGDNKTKRGDMNLPDRANQYALTDPGERVVLVTNDGLFRLRCQNGSAECVSPQTIEDQMIDRLDASG